MKNKFVKLECSAELTDGSRHEWAEWFCMSETWTHPYNTRDNAAVEFQDWCRANWKSADNPGNPVCPDVKCGGAKLNDGWGSDMPWRIGGIVAGSDCDWAGDGLADGIEDALNDGCDRRFEYAKDGRKLVVRLRPTDDFVPDEDSLADFGPYADMVRAQFKKILAG